MTNFIPEENNPDQPAPYFQDAFAADGWGGHTTEKTTQKLQSEIKEIVARLGGLVTGFQKGTFTVGSQRRDGYQVHFVLESATDVQKGRFEIAALPVRPNETTGNVAENLRKKSLKMALYMLRDHLSGLWYIQQLSPGHASLMPFILDPNTGKTYSQLFGEGVDLTHLLPAGDFKSAEPWWQVLGVSKVATPAEIKKKHRELAKKYHPDHGGDQDTFVKIQKAFEEALEKTP